MQLADVLDYTRVARQSLASGGHVIVIEKDPYLSIVLRRGSVGEEDYAIAHTRLDVPIVAALLGIHVTGDRWEYLVPTLSQSTPYHRDCAQVRVAVADRLLPDSFIALIDDRTQEGIERVRSWAAYAELLRTGATAACLIVA